MSTDSSRTSTNFRKSNTTSTQLNCTKHLCTSSVRTPSSTLNKASSSSKSTTTSASCSKTLYRKNCYSLYSNTHALRISLNWSKHLHSTWPTSSTTFTGFRLWSQSSSTTLTHSASRSSTKQYSLHLRPFSLVGIWTCSGFNSLLIISTKSILSFCCTIWAIKELKQWLDF